MKTLTPILLALATVALLATSASAQESPGFVDPTDVQNDLLTKGLEASRGGDYAAAARFYDSVLSLGDLNVAYLNKGRALQKAGDCAGAAEAFDKVLGAPMVKSPEPDAVKAALERFRTQLRAACPGIVVVECSTDKIVLTLDGKPLKCAEERKLDSGRYVLIAKAFRKEIQRDIEIVGSERTTIKMDISADKESVVVGAVDPNKKKDDKKKDDKKDDKKVEEGSVMGTIGWALVGTGAAGIALGAVSGVLVEGVNDDIETISQDVVINRAEFEDLQSDGDLYTALQFVGYGVGAAALIGGAVLIVMDMDGGEEAPSEGVSVVPVPGPGDIGAGLEVRF